MVAMVILMSYGSIFFLYCCQHAFRMSWWFPAVSCLQDLWSFVCFLLSFLQSEWFVGNVVANYFHCKAALIKLIENELPH